MQTQFSRKNFQETSENTDCARFVNMLRKLELWDPESAPQAAHIQWSFWGWYLQVNSQMNSAVASHAHDSFTRSRFHKASESFTRQTQSIWSLDWGGVWKIPYSISHLAHIASVISYFFVPRKNPCETVVLPLKGIALCLLGSRYSCKYSTCTTAAFRYECHADSLKSSCACW